MANPLQIRPASEMAADIQGTSTESTDAFNEDPKSQREYSFDFSHKDGRGKTWAGRFTNQVLSIRQRQQVGALKAQLGAGLPSEALDAYTQALNEQIAHLTISLIKRPDWAKELGDLFDHEIITKLYEEVASHEAWFREPGKHKEEGAESDGDGSRAA